MKPRTRFAVFLFSLAGLPILVVAVLLIALFWDDPPVQDADLRPRREVIPDAENAFTHFEQALANLSATGPVRWRMSGGATRHLCRARSRPGVA